MHDDWLPIKSLRSVSDDFVLFTLPQDNKRFLATGSMDIHALEIEQGPFREKRVWCEVLFGLLLKEYFLRLLNSSTQVIWPKQSFTVLNCPMCCVLAFKS